MADNIYYLEDYINAGIQQVTDDGSGNDWIIITGTYPMQFGYWGASVYMSGTAPLSSTVYYRTYPGGTPTLNGVTFYGQIENAQGGGGDESFTGGAIANMIVGDPDGVAGGNDALHGGAGADTMLGGGGSDWLHGNDDNDLMFGEFDPNSNPASNYAPGNDSLFGDNGNDTMSGGYGTNNLDGGDGYDTADYSGFFDDFGNTTYRIVTNLEAGTTTVYAYDLFNHTETVVASDTLTSIEVVIGTGGDDRIEARLTFAPTDFPGSVLHGGAGRDTLWGGPGMDALFGGEGDDTLSDFSGQLPGRSGVDLMNGGNGNDYYTVFFADTTIIEAANFGFDYVVCTISYTLAANIERLTLAPTTASALNGTGNASDNFFEGNIFGNDLNGLAGHDYANGFAANDTLRGGTGNDSMFGGTEDDSLIGGSQNDLLLGDAGADRLFGGSETDKLYGGSQDDFLQGGLGRDVLRGGTGADTFFFASASEAATGRGAVDLIEDFRTRLDHIDLHRIATGQAFIGNAAFGGVGNAEVRYNLVTGVLTGDTDGNGTVDYQINLGAGTALVAGDLIL